MTSLLFAQLPGKIEALREAGEEVATTVLSLDEQAFFSAAVVLSCAIAIAALAGFVIQRRARRPIDSCAKLFRDLCVVHGLDEEDCETLLDAAAASGLRGVEVFVRPDALDSLAERLADPAAQNRCGALRRRLFGVIQSDRDEFADL